MEKPQTLMIDGNQAAAEIAHFTNEVIALYPIIPASPWVNGWMNDSRSNSRISDPCGPHECGNKSKEALIKSNYFRLVKIAHIFPEDRRNRITITTHFEKDTNTILAPEFN